MNLSDTKAFFNKTADRAKPWGIFCILPGYFLYAETALVLLAGRGFSHPEFLIGFAAAGGLLLAGLIAFLPKKSRAPAGACVLLLTALLFSVESIVRSVFLTYMEPAKLLSGAQSVASGYRAELTRSILYGLPKAALFFVPAGLLAALLFRMKPETGRRQAVTAAALGAAFFLLFSGAARNGSMRAVYEARFSFSRTTETFGLLTSSRLYLLHALTPSGGGSFMTETVKADPAEVVREEPEPSPTVIPEAAEAPEPVVFEKNELDLDFAPALGRESTRGVTEYILSEEASFQNEYTGLFAGKNLILIAAESYADAFIREDTTPTLWRLTHNGFYFSDYYQPEWGGSTTTGEMSFLVGLAPLWGNESMVKTAGHDMHFTMGQSLMRQGYHSWAFHNGAYDYYSRQKTHENLGYEHWIANETGMAERCGHSYPSDTEMIENTMDLYIGEQPFSVYYMTGSGHAPYIRDKYVVQKYYDEVKAAYGGEYEEKTLYYICCQMELEAALSRLVARLEEAGIADDTVIALVGDHYPYGLGTGEAWGNDKNYIKDLLKAPLDHVWERDKNGLIIWSGCLENENRDMQCEISSPVMSLDVLPTLLNLYGIGFDSRLLPGRDVFADTQPLVFWNTFEWVTERGRYDWRERTFYPAEGFEDDPAYVENISRVVANKLEMSRVIVETDYYRMLFGNE